MRARALAVLTIGFMMTSTVIGWSDEPATSLAPGRYMTTSDGIMLTDLEPDLNRRGEAGRTTVEIQPLAENRMALVISVPGEQTLYATVEVMDGKRLRRTLAGGLGHRGLLELGVGTGLKVLMPRGVNDATKNGDQATNGREASNHKSRKGAH